MAVLLRAEGLVKRYGDFTAVKGVSFSVEEGEVFGFLGPNGAGKTTTINMLTGLARITAGQVSIDGMDYTHRPKLAQAMVGVVPDESNLYDELSGFENLSFCASLYGMERAERERRATELLSLFDLADVGDRLFKAYSKGMKRKLTIAAGIIHRPRMLFLDEPTTGIDVASARRIRSLIRELNASGTTVFLTTHYIEEAERLCHRIAFIVEGSIARVGAVRDLLDESQTQHAVHFQFTDGGETPSRLKDEFSKTFPDVQAEAFEDGSIRVHSDQQVSLMPFMSFFEGLGLTVLEARIVRPTLEDVFVKVTGVELAKMKSEREGRRR